MMTAAYKVPDTVRRASFPSDECLGTNTSIPVCKRRKQGPGQKEYTQDSSVREWQTRTLAVLRTVFVAT